MNKRKLKKAIKRITNLPEGKYLYLYITNKIRHLYLKGSKSITGDAEKLEFVIDGVVFKPFFDTYGRHSVYLDVTLK